MILELLAANLRLRVVVDFLVVLDRGIPPKESCACVSEWVFAVVAQHNVAAVVEPPFPRRNGLALVLELSSIECKGWSSTGTHP